MFAFLPNPTMWLASGSVAWIVMWAVLASLTIALLILLRTRWRQTKAWRKCAVLSLWVHVLLACLAAMLQIVSGAPGVGPDPPMRIRIVASAAETEADQQPPTQPEPQEAEAQPEDAAEPPAEVKPSSEETEPLAPIVDTPSPELTDVDAVDDTQQELQPEQVAASLDETRSPEPSEPDQMATDSTTSESSSPHLPRPDPTVEPMEVQTPNELKEAHTPPDQTLLQEQHDADVDAANRVVDARSIQMPPPVATTQTKDTDSNPPTLTSRTTHALPDAYANRTSERRAQAAAASGGNARTERAVKSALAWLAAAQSDDGRWDAALHGAGKTRIIQGRNYGVVGVQADAGVSGLALLAFLGAGHTQFNGIYSDTVNDGLNHLRASQQPNGAMYGQAQTFARTYCHSMATFAAAEAYAMTGDQQLAQTVRRAASYSLAMQHPTDGGWRYAYGQAGDTSQLGWQLMALTSAQRAGVTFPHDSRLLVNGFLRRVERGTHGGLAVYRPEEAHPTHSMTAEALLCRLLMDQRRTGDLTGAAVDEAIALLLRQTPQRSELNLYYWYYATLALHRVRDTSAYRSEAWQRWNAALTDALLSTQRNDGSWSESTVWGKFGGRVYTTAMAALCLESYYRYADPPQLPDQPNVARRRRGAPRARYPR